MYYQLYIPVNVMFFLITPLNCLQYQMVVNVFRKVSTRKVVQHYHIFSLLLVDLYLVVHQHGRDYKYSGT